MTATGTHRWLVVDGDLDAHTSPALRRCLLALTEEGVTDVVMDLTPVRRFDDAGVAVLLEAVEVPWELRWRRPSDDAVAAALGEALLMDFEALDDLAAPRPTSVVWVARRHDEPQDSAPER